MNQRHGHPERGTKLPITLALSLFVSLAVLPAAQALDAGKPASARGSAPLPTTQPLGDVKGNWFTDRDKALAEAQKTKKPILAVTMDGG
jgi:hypothetical protein